MDEFLMMNDITKLIFQDAEFLSEFRGGGGMKLS